MATSTDIANAALLALGEREITAITDESNANARRINARYENVRQTVLRMHLWNVAMRRAALTQLVGTPASVWDFAYALPVDFIRVAEVRDGSDVLIHFSIERHPSGPPTDALALALLTDSSDVALQYVSDIDADDMDPLLFKAVALSLAMDVGFTITKSNTTMERIKADLKDVMSEARFNDAAETSSVDLFIDNWEHARRHGSLDEIPDHMLLSFS